MYKDVFDPDDIRIEDMKLMAEHLAAYLGLLQEVMIIPDEIMDEHGKTINEGIKRTQKLINKLRKGDTSVFKDIDD